MTSVEEPVAEDVSGLSAHTEAVPAAADATTQADTVATVVPTEEEKSEAAAPPPHAPAAIQVHAPYQVDAATPRASLSVANGGTPAAAAAAAASNTPTTKVKGRPSQAAQLAARAAYVKETPQRSASQGAALRSQRRQLSLHTKSARPVKANNNNNTAATAAGGDGASATGPAVLATSTRRLGGANGELNRSASSASPRANGGGSILVRRPRFVDPAAHRPSTPGPATSAAAAAVPVSPVTVAEPTSPTLLGSMSHRKSTSVPPASTAAASAHHNGHNNSHRTNSMSSASGTAASHASLYLHPIARSHVARGTSHRTSVSSDKVAADAQHRQQLLSSTQSTAASASTTAAPAAEEEAREAREAVSGGDPLAPPPASDLAVEVPKAESADTDSDAPAKTKKEEDEAAPAAAPASEPTPAATTATTTDTPTTTATATTATSAVPSKPGSQVRIPSSGATMHHEKRVVHSRPSSTAYAMRMTELTRPSEAYKMNLGSTALQGSALARRSRQPRKVLNVFLTKYPIIRRLADELDFVMETTEEELNEYKFNLCWSDTVLSLMRLVRLSNWQRTNHFPSMYLLCRKGHLGTTLGKLRHRLPSHFAFYPRTWSMRSERLQFTQYMTAVRQRHVLKYFIMKPNSGCQGRGIIVARDPLTALDDHALDNYIVQEYVHRPLLLEGKKFDLRVYVLLTSIRHPSIFMFNDGLVRICTEAYETPTEENVKNACKHLTNYAVNKKSTEYVFNTDVERMDVGNKRNFAFLNRWLEESGHSSAELWHQVGMIIVKTILAAQPSIARVYDSCFPTGYNDGYCCFEVLGFDILIDSKMRPWLMEVNHTPSFATDTPLDMDIKSKLLREVWSIIDCKATDYEKDRQRERDEFTKRNMPPWTANHPVYGSQLSQSTARQGPVDSAESSTELNSPSANNGANGNGAAANANAEMPAYVHTRRKHEDSKLRNFKRIYPAEEEEVQVMYDTIQNLAMVESANSRLYYNTTVAAPLPPTAVSGGTAPFGMRSNNVMPLRSRPPTLLGSLNTASRPYSSMGSPSTSTPQRHPASPSTANGTAAAAVAPAATTPAPMAPPNGAPATITVSSVPSLSAVREGNASASTAASSPSPPPATSPTATASSTARSRAAAAQPHTSVPPSGADNSAAPAAPPLSAAALASDGGRRSGAATPKAADKTPRSPQPVRIFTPRVSSPVVNARAAVTPPPPPPPATPKMQLPASGAEAQAKPRVAEVHRRVQSRPPVVAPTASSLTAATPPPEPPAPAAAPSASTPEAPLPAADEKPSSMIRITRRSLTRQKSPSLEASLKVADAQPRPSPSAPASVTKRRSQSMSGSGPEGPGTHTRQKSAEHEGRGMSTHPEPTEEELARLVALQAQLDYEAAADPEPDDEDDDYNLTE